MTAPRAVHERPIILDAYCGAGGAARGYQDAGFECVGIDNRFQPRYIGEHFIQADALDALSTLANGGFVADQCDPPCAWHLGDFAAIHASPPCQGYSIMHNLPWLRGREYPLLILPTIELLEALGKPYVLENVMGARHGAKGLQKRGLEAHGLKAGWLCGGMLGLPFYRHRLFATNWAWLAPGHPKHRSRILAGRGLGERAHNIIFSPSEDKRGIESWPNRRPYNRGLSGVLSLTPPNADVHQSFSVRAASPTLAKWQNGAQAKGVGHAKGWRLAAEAMGIDWMKREELTQAIPPAYTCFIGTQLLTILEAQIND